MPIWFVQKQRWITPRTRRRLVSECRGTVEALEARVVLEGGPITVNSVADIAAVDGRINGTVATFTDTNQAASTKDYKAIIQWGDGSTSKGRIATAEGEGFVVTGKHRYRTSGEFPVTVIVNDKSGNVASDGGYDVQNLVSTQPGVAPTVDPNLINAWGLASSATGRWAIVNAGSGVQTIVTGTGEIDPLVVTIPTPPGVTGPSAPTGNVSNRTPDFVVTGGASRYIYSTEDGTIAAWNSGASADLVVDNSATGAIYKGLATGSVGASNFIYATDFHNGRIDVFDKNFAPTQLAGNFQLPKVPKGYAPFGIENISGKLFVTYAKQDAGGVDDAAKYRTGYVAEFTTDGQFVQIFAAKGELNSPWGLALAPENFGQYSNALLVGNFGDGFVHAFDAQTGDLLGTISDSAGQPIPFSGLWALKFGNGGLAGDTNDLYFTAGPDNEQEGLFGVIEALGDPTQAIVSVGSSRAGRSSN